MKKKFTKKGPSTHDCDKLWSEIVKLKAKGRCEYCPKTDYLNAHHFYSRSNFSIRWDTDNGFALCPLHHTLGNWSAHKNPAEFVEWAQQTRGVKWYKTLREKRNKTVKVDSLYRKKIFILLTDELNQLTP